MEANRKGRRTTAAIIRKIPQTNFAPEEILELQEMQRMVNAERYKATLVAGNTALIPRGQEIAKELDAIARLLDNAKNQWVSQKLTQHGYPQDSKCNINLTTGEIKLEQEPPAPAKEAEKEPKKA